MSGVYWGSREVADVTASGSATQLFPVGVPSTEDTTTYPPASDGKVKRATSGMIDHIDFESDGVNGGVVELWDVEGLDRGGSNNVNNDDLLTDAFLSANGTLIAKIQIKPSAGTGHPFGSTIGKIPFNKGLAVRFVGVAGVVNVAPYIEGGFLVQLVVAA